MKVKFFVKRVFKSVVNFEGNILIVLNVVYLFNISNIFFLCLVCWSIYYILVMCWFVRIGKNKMGIYFRLCCISVLYCMV